MKKYGFTAGLLTVIALVCYLLTSFAVGQSAEKEDTFTVVTSFYPMYIAAENIIGDSSSVILENLSEPKTGCMHDFQLTPKDMKLLSDADVFIINGGGMENFLPDVKAQYPNLTIIDTSENVKLLTSDGEENAHMWLSVPYYRKQAAAIADGLEKADEKNASVFQENAALYDKKLAELEEEQKELVSAAKGKKIISFHEAYAYTAFDYGMEIVYTMDLDEERQISAGEVAEVLSEIEENGVGLILAEERYGKEMGDTIKKEADVNVCYLDTLNRGDYDADSYITGMQENIKLLKEAFGVTAE